MTQYSHRRFTLQELSYMVAVCERVHDPDNSISTQSSYKEILKGSRTFALVNNLFVEEILKYSMGKKEAHEMICDAGNHWHHEVGRVLFGVDKQYPPLAEDVIIAITAIYLFFTVEHPQYLFFKDIEGTAATNWLKDSTPHNLRLVYFDGSMELLKNAGGDTLKGTEALFDKAVERKNDLLAEYDRMAAVMQKVHNITGKNIVQVEEEMGGEDFDLLEAIQSKINVEDDD